MNITKRGIVAAVASAALLLTGVAAVPAQAATKTITIWADDARGPALKTFLEGNTKIAPGYTFKITTYAGYDALDSAWKKATASGGPDVMFHPAGEGVNAAKSGKAVPLTFSATEKSQLGAAALGAGTYKGRTYVVPLDVDTTTMIWNTKFGAAPKTFADLVTRFKAAKAAGTATTGICSSDGTWGSLPILTALGGGAWGYKADGITPDPSQIIFNSPEAVTNWNKYLVDPTTKKSNGVFAWDGWEVCGPQFLAGKIMALNTGSWRIGDIQKAGVKYTLQPVPTVNGKGKTHQWTGFGGAFVTSFAAKHGVELGAKKLMQYLAAPAGALAYAKAVNRPAVNSAIASKVSSDAAGFGKAGASNGVVQENALLGSNAGGANWYDVLGDVYSKILVKGQDVQATLDKAAVILYKNFVAGMKNR
ncbi:MAG: hypothetical protein RLY88_781 [Actinomycetota bacterium]